MLASLSETQRREILQGLTDRECLALLYDWRFWARPKQLAPDGDWFIWLINAGRGFGKTRAGGGWFHERAMAEARELALIAKTPADARDYCIQGPGGILRNAPPWERPHYEPSKRRLTWANGSVATIYSSEEPDQLRGFNGDTAWLDEFAKYRAPKDVLDNLLFGMREASGDQPRLAVTTTPRPKVLKLIRKHPKVAEVRGSSYENRGNLDPTWFSNVVDPLRGTRLGRQEIFAEELEDTPGALWTLALIDEHRATARTMPQLVKVRVGVDPAVSSGDGSAETGIVVAGLGEDGHVYVLGDYSLMGSPYEWGAKAVKAYDDFRADRIVGETNNGGDLVEVNIRVHRPRVAFEGVHASRGKHTRAEPVSTLYEQGRVHHVGVLPDLEDQMTTWVPGEKSPDRMDALVWAITSLGVLEQTDMDMISFL